MKTSKVCPKCDGRKFFHITSMKQTYCDASTVIRTVEVFATRVPTGEKGLLGDDKTELVSTDPFESFVCAGCGFVEWYASPGSLRVLARIAEKSSDVRVVTNESPEAPFR